MHSLEYIRESRNPITRDTLGQQGLENFVEPFTCAGGARVSYGTRATDVYASACSTYAKQEHVDAAGFGKFC